MKSPTRSQREDAFTLIELIGVLAVVSILTAILVPRIMHAIEDGKVANTVGSCSAVKSAVNEYYSRYGKFGGPGGAELSIAAGNSSDNWDMNCLIPEGFMEKPFSARIGNGRLGVDDGGSQIRVINISGLTSDNGAAGDLDQLNSGAYDWDGTGTPNDIHGSLLVEACIEEVEIPEARDLSRRIDGEELSTASGPDTIGRVKYIITESGLAKVRIYLAHR